MGYVLLSCSAVRWKAGSEPAEDTAGPVSSVEWAQQQLSCNSCTGRWISCHRPGVAGAGRSSEHPWGERRLVKLLDIVKGSCIVTVTRRQVLQQDRCSQMTTQMLDAAMAACQNCRHLIQGLTVRLLQVKVIINDRVDVAIAAGADGVHVGQDDMPCQAVRSLVGPDMIIGVSCKTPEQARAAAAAGADYLGVGAGAEPPSISRLWLVGSWSPVCQQSPSAFPNTVGCCGAPPGGCGLGLLLSRRPGSQMLGQVQLWLKRSKGGRGAALWPAE